MGSPLPRPVFYKSPRGRITERRDRSCRTANSDRRWWRGNFNLRNYLAVWRKRNEASSRRVSRNSKVQPPNHKQQPMRTNQEQEQNIACDSPDELMSNLSGTIRNLISAFTSCGLS